MNIRAIHIRLILWYSGLVVLVSLAFGAYVYQGVQARLYGEIEQTLVRRAHQIGEHILARTPKEKPSEIANQIHDVYSPEASNRFIRILREDHSIIYLSDIPKDGVFNPSELPLPKNNSSKPHFESLPNNVQMMVVPVLVEAAGQHYLIEMGALTEGPQIALRGLITTLLLGLPIVVLMVSFGGYILVRRALQPVENIRATAEQITFGNLSNRLPVALTGDALEHLSITLNQMLERLEDAYDQASRFSADASHELRTPLTIMRGELESMMRDSGIPNYFKERIGSVLEETERLSRIAENLFAISRLDAGEAKVQHEKFDLAALTQNTAEQMALLADEKRIALHIHTFNPAFVSGDSARMKQVIVNLLDNAIKYTPEGGTVQLHVKTANHKAILEMMDTGVGIPLDAQQHVFERFYRVDKVRSREMGGAGLGLSIVRSIVQAHGGTVDIQSAEGKGTKVTVELPLSNGQEHKS